MGKKITVILFSILIVVSAVFVNSLFVEDYAEDDIFGDSLTIYFQIMFNIVVLVSEIDWFYNIMYSISNKKEKGKTVLNILSGICSVGMLVTFLFLDSFSLILAEILMASFLLLYFLTRIIYFVKIISNHLNKISG